MQEGQECAKNIMAAHPNKISALEEVTESSRNGNLGKGGDRMATQFSQDHSQEISRGPNPKEMEEDEMNSFQSENQEAFHDDNNSWSPPMPANMKVVEDGLGLINWEYFLNVHHSSLCRILVGWNADKVGVAMVHSASQWLTCDVTTLEDGSKIRVSFVYGLNSPLGRKALWDYLEQQKTPNSTIPWAILGDFNAILSSSDKHGGDDQWHSHMDDFPSCIGNSELIHVQTTGLHFTWHNGQHANATILRRLDWAFGNQTLLMKWPLIRTTIQPRTISDHSPLLLGWYPSIPRRKARFKFINSWVNQEGYDEAVQAERNRRVFNNSARSIQTISLELFRQIRDKISNLGTQSSIPEVTRSFGLQAASLGIVFRRGAPPSQMGVRCSLWALLSGWLARWVSFKGRQLRFFVMAP
ncbi:hypothetical protein DKX38_028218 [Salix brachista]|uniref:Endonuclease/exonuclease/phosphatase domain-containing protein n=1 Tax=Salix brachista TaxID=2182728 RepID=A0A5N5J673_9ROSI|nr:hypothetical protein DKX38_028218 [Salix brachista]